jgi:hypothetical protein
MRYEGDSNDKLSIREAASDGSRNMQSATAREALMLKATTKVKTRRKRSEPPDLRAEAFFLLIEA